MKIQTLILSLALSLAPTINASAPIWEEPIKLNTIIPSSTVKYYKATKEDVDELVWSFKAAMRNFAPEPIVQEGDTTLSNINTYYLSFEHEREDPNSPEALRRKARELEQQAAEQEQKIKDQKKAWETLAKWEDIQKGFNEGK